MRQIIPITWQARFGPVTWKWNALCNVSNHLNHPVIQHKLLSTKMEPPQLHWASSVCTVGESSGKFAWPESSQYPWYNPIGTSDHQGSLAHTLQLVIKLVFSSQRKTRDFPPKLCILYKGRCQLSRVQQAGCQASLPLIPVQELHTLNYDHPSLWGG